jgi:hypothetical protein
MKEGSISNVSGLFPSRRALIPPSAVARAIQHYCMGAAGIACSARSRSSTGFQSELSEIRDENQASSKRGEIPGALVAQEIATEDGSRESTSRRFA